jgi:hypothetical protein
MALAAKSPNVAHMQALQNDNNLTVSRSNSARDFCTKKAID